MSRPAAHASRPASHQPACSASAHCRPAGPLLAALGLCARTPGRWLHLGPIGPRTTPLTSHPLSQQPPPPPPNSQQRDADLIRTWPELRAHLGYRLDLFGLDRRPPVQARYLAPALLWIVYAVAWTEPGAPFAVWASRLDRPCHLVYDFDGAAPSADAVAALGRMADLIIGRGRRRGRRSYAEDTTWRTIAEDAEARYAARPGQGWRPIAAVLGVDLRTLSRYRALLAREATSAVRPVPTLLSGGLGG